MEEKEQKKSRLLAGLFFLDILGCGAGNRTRSGRLCLICNLELPQVSDYIILLPVGRGFGV